MTVAAPIESAERLVGYLSLMGPPGDPLREAMAEVLAFVEHFRMKPLPGMSQEVVAGEIPEVRLADDTLEAEEIGLIRLNGRVYVPEEVKAFVDPFGLTDDEAWEQLVNFDDRTSPAEYPDMALITREELSHFMRSSAVCELGVEVSGDPVDLDLSPAHIEQLDKLLEAELRPTAPLSIAEALVGYETIARLSDAHPETPGAVVVGFNNPRSSWQLFALLQQAVAGNGQ